MTDSPVDENKEAVVDTAAADKGAADTAANTTDTKAVDTKGGTFVDDNSDPLPGAATWPEDWRQKFAGGDEKFLKQLERMKSPADLAKSYRELEKNKAALPKALPENPSEEDLKAWRADNGIPESYDKYDLTFDDGLVVGEEDKADLEPYLKDMHGINASPDFVKAGVKAYLRAKDNALAAQKELENKTTQEMVDHLRQEWGPEYRAKMNGVKAFLAQLPEGMNDKLQSLRYSDGTPALNDPQFFHTVMEPLMDAVMPHHTLVNITGQAGVGAQERIDQIKQIIRDEPERYYKGAEGQKLQSELQKLVDYQAKSSGKAA